MMTEEDETTLPPRTRWQRSHATERSNIRWLVAGIVIVLVCLAAVLINAA